MEQFNHHKQALYDALQYGSEQLQFASQDFTPNPASSIASNARPTEFRKLDVGPVHNFSIQTGEEFALEFMLDRVNPRKPSIQNCSGDHCYKGGYMDLKSILGVNHSGSESESGVSMLNMVEKGPQELERKNPPLYGDPQTSSGIGTSQVYVHGHASLGASERSLKKMKLLCSFGGKILPRPSDGRLRYVGGETRIIQINKNISWNELKKKTAAIFSEAYIIKYQLPGEDLDALVSVSCDEDLQNMMEECSMLKNGDGANKLRIFLCSMSDLDDSHFGLGSLDGDSEIQYLEAVNGIDTGSRKNSNLHGLMSFSATNLDELHGQSVDGETARATHGSDGASLSHLIGNTVSPSAIKFSQSVLSGCLNASGESLVPTKGPMLNGFHVVDPEKLMEKEKLESGGLLQRDCQTEKFTPLQNDHTAPLQPVANSVPENDRKNQEHLKVSFPFDVITPNLFPKSNLDGHCVTPGNDCGLDAVYADSVSGPINMNCFDPPSASHRVCKSERIPRGQAEFSNRLSKSDDSFCSQFLNSHSLPDIIQPDSVTGSFEKLYNENPMCQTEQPSSAPSEMHFDSQTIDGLTPILKHKAFSDATDQNNLKLLEDMSTFDLQLKVPEIGCTGLNEDEIRQIDCRKTSSVDDKIALVNEEPAVAKLDNTKDNLLKIPESLSVKVTDTPDFDVCKFETPREKQGDILIDINDRFPRDFLADIFSQVAYSEDFSGASLLHKDAAGLSMNVENHEPQHWSFFQKLAQVDFDHGSFSAVDQDHFSLPSAQSDVENGASRPNHVTPLMGEKTSVGDVENLVNFGEENPKESALLSGYNDSEIKGHEHMLSDNMVDDLRTQLEYADEVSFVNVGLPPLGPSLGSIDMKTLQVIKIDDLEELKELGSGTFGTVYHGKWRGTDVAIKRIKKSCIAGRSSEQERLADEFWQEAGILSKLHHPNVVAFYGVVQDELGETLAAVTEFMVDGSLRHVLLRKDWYLDRRKRLIIAMDAAFGMEYLHSKNIVHFDLKCDNLLVNLKDPLRPICKVGDFGLSKIKRNTLVSGGLRGTLPWMAPELLNGSSNKVSEKVDVFSFGIVLWEILMGEEPYANMHYGAIIGGIVSNTLRPPIPSSCDPEWRKLMEQCWAPNPMARPSFTEIADRLRQMSARSRRASK